MTLDSNRRKEHPDLQFVREALGVRLGRADYMSSDYEQKISDALARLEARLAQLEWALREVMPKSHHPTCAVYLPQRECDCGFGDAETALGAIE